MSDIKIELNEEGIRQMLQSPQMKRVVQSRASEIAGRLGEGYSAKTKVVKDRYSAVVSAESFEAKLDNNKHNTILKALRS
ncbi:MAG: hypothetical protein Q4B85_06660 [Lachnospiraceae bacterium]|nr:hypothetical protein [Lachnospiraceae bacterium]